MIFVANTETKEYILKIVPNIDISTSHSEKYLTLDGSYLTLITGDNSLTIDFASKEIANRINPKAKKCSVVQAVEGRNKNKLKILDTTAGLGRDSFTLAARGHSVVAIEKDPYIFLLLSDALDRAKQHAHISDIANNITFINDDSSEYITACSNSFDCAYVDPMFPERKKSAKVKKDMQIMHNVAFNSDENNNDILTNLTNRKLAKKIIVKRPVNAEFLANKKPSSQLKGKTNRFDIYLV